ncbi:sensor histidine kinase [Methyloversatilis thermotolerans]|uniref:sensor histidine kinase n=1 Tax=Methyloversatilis thermotolerans TaxID=1346290 RepID=UPI0003605CB4|nr:HAMP domain-containing sensor histidine kinase [Methyloversatilis thermotolerans]
MTRGTNLKLTLMVRITLLAVVIGALASAALIWRTTSRLQAEAVRNADLVSRLITDQMSRQLSGLELNIGKPDLSRFAEFSEVTRLCVQYFDLDGQLSANSCNQDVARNGEYAPAWFRELIRYMLNRRIDRGADADTSGAPGVRVGRRVLWYQPYGVGLDVGRAPGLKMGEVLIRVDADRESGAVWQEITGLLGGAALAVLAFNLLIYLSISRALRPASAVMEGLAQLERGDLGARLPPFELAEFDRIGSVFNAMAGNLQQKTHEQQRLAQMLLTVQEGERRRLARELHDEFGQSLASISAEAACIVDESDQPLPQKPALRASGAAIARTVSRMMESLHGILRQLRPVGLDEYGLIAGLDRMVRMWDAQARGRCRYMLDVDGDFGDLPDDIAINLYRIVQECLTNAAKHSGATAVEVKLERRADSDDIRLRVIDDGIVRGPHLPVKRSGPGGFGLIGVKERVVALGGRVRLSAREPQGLVVDIEVPWRLAAHAEAA